MRDNEEKAIRNAVELCQELLHSINLHCIPNGQKKLYNPVLRQCMVHNRCSIDICWIKSKLTNAFQNAYYIQDSVPMRI